MLYSNGKTLLSKFDSSVLLFINSFKSSRVWRVCKIPRGRLNLYAKSTYQNTRIENCPKFILQHSHIYNLYDNWWHVFLKVEITLWLEAFSKHLLRWIAFSRQTQAHIAHWQTTPTFIFIFSLTFLFRIFPCIFSTYWTLMLWYFKHIYFQKLLIYVKVRDTNLAICFFRLMDFSYEIVMAIYIEEVIGGQELFSLKIYAGWQLLNVNVQDAELIFKNIS